MSMSHSAAAGTLAKSCGGLEAAVGFSDSTKTSTPSPMSPMTADSPSSTATSDTSPIHWRYGAIARMEPGQKIDDLLKGGYSTLSLGYIGIYEMTKLVKGVSHTAPEGKQFALKVMKYLKDTVAKWKKETNIGFALYGTPAESLCYKFAKIDKELFGEIKDVTDKGYYTNSYHVDVREKIDAFEKLSFESEFQKLSTGGAISYIEIPNMKNNLEALETVVKFIYNNIQYAEVNTKSDYCHVCGFDGEIIVNDNNEWECPQCGNKDHAKMNVVRRTCGYLGENFWNVGKTKEIKARVLHVSSSTLSEENSATANVNSTGVSCGCDS